MDRLNTFRLPVFLSASGPPTYDPESFSGQAWAMPSSRRASSGSPPPTTRGARKRVCSSRRGGRRVSRGGHRAPSFLNRIPALTKHSRQSNDQHHTVSGATISADHPAAGRGESRIADRGSGRVIVVPIKDTAKNRNGRPRKILE